ncbi:MAG: hypothetical protein CMF55_00490 [Legionellales bacterium]|nr:hypothetical protein [Legionellales bacterium]
MVSYVVEKTLEITRTFVVEIDSDEEILQAEYDMYMLPLREEELGLLLRHDLKSIDHIERNGRIMPVEEYLAETDKYTEPHRTRLREGRELLITEARILNPNPQPIDVWVPE